MLDIGSGKKVVESYRPNPGQSRFHALTTKYKCAMGGFGSGKTKAGLSEIIDLAMRFPGNRIAVMRDTKTDLKDSTQHDFFDNCPPELIYSYQKNEGVATLVNGSEFIFRSFRQYKSSPRNQNEGKIKSLNLGAFYIDEANEVGKNEFLLLQGRLRLSDVPEHCGILTTNPPNKSHWIYELFSSDEADKSIYGIVHMPTRDNKAHLPKSYIEDLERTYPASWLDKFLEGQYGFMSQGTPVYDNFREDTHCKKLIFQEHLPLMRSWDFGWRHPAVVFFQITTEGHFRVLEEVMGHNVFLNDFAQEVFQVTSNHFPGARVVDFGDPAGNQSNPQGTSKKGAIETLREMGVRVISRRSEVGDGVERIQDMLARNIHGDPAFQIDKEYAPILVAGFLGGYEKDADGKPLKDGYYEHVHDALRYGVINNGGRESTLRQDFKNLHIPSPTWGFRSATDQKLPVLSSPDGAGWRLR